MWVSKRSGEVQELMFSIEICNENKKFGEKKTVKTRGDSTELCTVRAKSSTKNSEVVVTWWSSATRLLRPYKPRQDFKNETKHLAKMKHCSQTLSENFGPGTCGWTETWAMSSPKSVTLEPGRQLQRPSTSRTIMLTWNIHFILCKSFLYARVSVVVLMNPSWDMPSNRQLRLKEVCLFGRVTTSHTSDQQPMLTGTQSWHCFLRFGVLNECCGLRFTLLLDSMLGKIIAWFLSHVLRKYDRFTKSRRTKNQQQQMLE